MCSRSDDPSQHDRGYDPRRLTAVQQGQQTLGRDIRKLHGAPYGWAPADPVCALGAHPSDVERNEPSGAVVALCYMHEAVGPCDDCHRWAGHNPDTEH